MWEPTTRGVDNDGVFCSYDLCNERNRNTAFTTTDFVGTRYFCEEHWEHINYLFRLIRVCDQCFRAHLADYYKDNRTLHTVKHNEKWWELCSHHHKIYEDTVTFVLPMDFFD